MKKTLAIVLALLMLVPALASCSEQTSGEDTSGTTTPTAGAEETVPEETEAPDPFADVDFDGREFRFYMTFFHAVLSYPPESVEFFATIPLFYPHEFYAKNKMLKFQRF